MPRSLVIDSQVNSCYFRTGADVGGRKALLQITERCNLHCAHCSVAARTKGCDMSLADIGAVVLPRLLEAKVERITVTGGEPFVHPDIIEICQVLSAHNLPISICTNATQTSDEQIAALSTLGNVHVNVSFDGFRANSHGKFRGNRASFDITRQTTEKFAAAGLLQGLASTPNTLTEVEEFVELCEFAAAIGAKYVRMNPLASFGRGAKSHTKLAASSQMMRAIAKATSECAKRGIELVYIRFPNDDQPLAACAADTIVYVGADGTTAVCPYLLFASRTPGSLYRESEFVMGNIFTDTIADGLDEYRLRDLPNMGDNATCGGCVLADRCGKGCPAAVISRSNAIGSLDSEQCPHVVG